MSTVVSVQGLGKRYHDIEAVTDVSFEVASGEIFGILGPNGAGKTTTVECLQGLRPFDRGSVSVLGFDPARQAAELSRQIGSQLQESALPDRIKVWEALDLYSSFYPTPANRDRLPTDLGLTEKRNTTF
ncbi:MAG TPA: ATP-binding cassette domain-containing protein, partial [Acidimicrobiia bacterium]|nr:ATP-binding cassette domain-containing protein [Acidimicrobiia bacterium]